MAGRFPLGGILFAAVLALLLFLPSGGRVEATTYSLELGFWLGCNGPDELPGTDDDSCTLGSDPYAAGETADRHVSVQIPSFGPPEHSQFWFQIPSVVPVGWSTATDMEIPDGAWVGALHATVNVGILGGPTNIPLYLDFPLFDCSTDNSPGNQVPWAGDGLNLTLGNAGDGLPRGCSHYPQHVHEYTFGAKPRSRYFGFMTIYEGAPPTQIELLTFSPGQVTLAGYLDPSSPLADMGDAFGYTAVFILDNPLAPLTPSPVTEFAPSMHSHTVFFGQTGGKGLLLPALEWFGPGWDGMTPVGDPCGDGFDNDADTLTDEMCGIVRGENPAADTGLYGTNTHLVSVYNESYRDADEDGIDNDVDECPFTVDTCANAVDDDLGDLSEDHDANGFIGWVNDGCPTTGAQDLDGDGGPNDGCPAVGPIECDLTNNAGDPDTPDGDCEDVGDMPTWCLNFVDDDYDGYVNDGCPELEGSPEATCDDRETGTQCENDTDDDGDGWVNDGCAQQGEQREGDNDWDGVDLACDPDDTTPDPDNDIDNDGLRNTHDLCPLVTDLECETGQGAGGNGVCEDAELDLCEEPPAGCAWPNCDDDTDGVTNDGCPVFDTGSEPGDGPDCDMQGDNDGVCLDVGEAELCENDEDDDGDTVVNDGCPTVGQPDQDLDRIGDTCDNVGYGPTTPDGAYVNDLRRAAVCIGDTDTDLDGWCDDTEDLIPGIGSQVLSDKNNFSSTPEYSGIDYPIVAAENPPGMAPGTCTSRVHYDTRRLGGDQFSEDADAETNLADLNCWGKRFWLGTPDLQPPGTDPLVLPAASVPGSSWAHPSGGETGDDFIDDDGNTVLSVGDRIAQAGANNWSRVVEVTAMMYVAEKPDLLDYKYLAFYAGARDMEDAIDHPLGTQWYEEVWFPFGGGPEYRLASWTDNTDGVLSASDQIVLTNRDNPLDSAEYHVEWVRISITRLPAEAASGGGGNDRDQDGVDDAVDNCVDDPNPEQTDIDIDDLGDACDPDDDSDRIDDVDEWVAGSDPKNVCSPVNWDNNWDGKINLADVLLYKGPGPVPSRQSCNPPVDYSVCTAVCQ